MLKTLEAEQAKIQARQRAEAAEVEKQVLADTLAASQVSTFLPFFTEQH